MAQITFGIEEELQVVSPVTGELEAHSFMQGITDIPHDVLDTSLEAHRCVIEIKTGICTSITDLVSQIEAGRKLAAARASLQGQQVLSAGVHPFSDWKQQALHDDPLEHPYYLKVLTQYGDVLKGALSFGWHFHVGLPNTVAPFPIFNVLRNRLAPLLAISVSSPFYDGRVTGLKSWRHSLLDRLPRMGTPDCWGSLSEYKEHIALLRKLGTLEPTQGFWEDLRVHHEFGTLEFRICDANPSLNKLWLIAALIQCEVEVLIDEGEKNQLENPMPRWALDENKWRVRRLGLDAALVTPGTETVVPLPVYLRQWLLRVKHKALGHGLFERLTFEMERLLAFGTTSDEMISQSKKGITFAGIVANLVKQTAQPFVR